MVGRWDEGGANELGSRGRDSLRFLFFRVAQAIGFHLVLEGGAADAEDFGRVGYVSAGFRQGIKDGPCLYQLHCFSCYMF